MKKALGIVLGFVVIAAIIGGITFFDPFGWNLFGGLSGNGGGTSEVRDPDNSAVVQSTAPTKEPGIVEVKVEGNNIFFDGTPCTDVNALKQKIIEIGQAKTYLFLHTDAIKETYDEVKTVLSELEEALDIVVIDE